MPLLDTLAPLATDLPEIQSPALPPAAHDAASGHAAAAPPSSVTNSRRLMPGMGSAPRCRRPIIAVGTAGCRRFDASGACRGEGQPVLGADLNRSESGASGQQSHDWTANHCRGDGSQMMRSIGRVEAPRWLSDKSPKAAGARTSEPIEIFWGKPMPGTANGRGPGK